MGTIEKIEEVYRVTFVDGTVEYHEKVIVSSGGDGGDNGNDKPDPDGGGGDDGEIPMWVWAVTSTELTVRDVPSVGGNAIWTVPKDTVFEVKGRETVDGDLWVWRETRKGYWIQELNLMTDERVLSIGVPGGSENGEWEAVVTSSYVNTREQPNRMGEVKQLNNSTVIDVRPVSRDMEGYDGTYVWWEIVGPEEFTDFTGRYVAEKSVDGTQVFLKVGEGVDPKALSGAIQPIRVVSPAGIEAMRFQNGDKEWSTDPKIAVKTRSIIVARERLEQFHYKDGQNDFYLSMPEDEYVEHMDQANNKTGNPYQMNIAYYGGFVAQREFFTGHETFTPNRLIDLTVRFCDDLAARNMQSMLVIKDALKHAHNFPAEDPYHTLGEHGRLNGQYYLDEAYEVQAIPFIEELAKEIAGHPGLAFVQLENESNIEGQPKAVADAYYKFARRVRDVWRKYDTASPFGLCIENTNKMRWKNEAGNLVSNEEVVAKFADLVDYWQAHMYADPNAKTIYDKWLDHDRVYEDLFTFAKQYGLVPFLDETFIQHRNAVQDVTNGTTEQARIQWTDMLDLGLYLITLWNYHQGRMDRRLTDAQSFTNVLEQVTGYLGYYDMRKLVAEFGHGIVPTYRWPVMARTGVL